MDIIPILPTPQQGTTPHPAELPTGTAETGFDEILRRGMRTPAPPSQSPAKTTLPAGRNKSDVSNPEVQAVASDLDSIETADSALNDRGEDAPSATGSSLVPSLLQTEKSRVQQYFLPNALGVIFNSTPADFSAPYTDFFSGSLSYSRTVSPQFSPTLPNVEQDAQSSALNRLNIFARYTGHGADFLQPAGTDQTQISAQPTANAAVSQAITLELQSSASPFSIKTAESLRITAEKMIVQAGFTSSTQTINPGSQRKHTLEPRTSDSIKPFAVSLLSNDFSSVKNSMPFDKGSIFFESSTVSFSRLGQAESAPAVQTAASAQQSTLMLEELQKLIRHNNDRLTITATLERTPAPDQAKSDHLLKPVQANPEQQHSSTETLFRMSTSPAPVAALNPQETAPQTKPEHLRSGLMEGFQEQFISSRSASSEQSSRNGTDQQMLQQHSQSADGSSQQQASDTTAARSTLPADQATPSPVFASQFHDTGSTLSSEATKLASPASAHLNLVRDQEIINQIVDRFSLHSRQQTSRLSLQLHPAELGELKIDLIVKGDVLKANIYTQTQQAGEIIDRNLSRLREILQDHGITVDELAVSFKSDNKDDFTPHHGQLFGDQNPLFKGQQRAETGSTFAQAIEDTFLTSEPKPPGVNLTI